jgi:hypothetical protein
MDGTKKRIPRAEFHGIFLDFCGMWNDLKSGKSIFRPKKRNLRFFSTFYGISHKKNFF